MYVDTLISLLKHDARIRNIYNDGWVVSSAVLVLAVFVAILLLQCLPATFTTITITMITMKDNNYNKISYDDANDSDSTNSMYVGCQYQSR